MQPDFHAERKRAEAEIGAVRQLAATMPAPIRARLDAIAKDGDHLLRLLD